MESEAKPQVDYSHLLNELGLRRFRIDVTSRCNFKCAFCPVKILDRKAVDFDLDRAKELLAEVSTLGSVEFVNFTLLGEPLLYPGIFELLEYAHILGLSTYIVTNGSLFSDKIVAQLVQHSPALIKVSLQSLDESEFKQIRGTSLSYENYLKSIRNMLVQRINQPDQFQSTVRIDIAINPRNSLMRSMLGYSLGEKSIEMEPEALAQTIYEFCQFLQEEIPSVKPDKKSIVQRVRRVFTTPMSDLPSALDISNPLVKLADNVVISTKTFIDFMEMSNYHKARYAYCRPKDLVVNINGDVTLCCQDWAGKNVLGNVFEGSLKEILLNSEEAIKALWTGKPDFEFCYQCTGAPTRRGVFLIDAKNTLKQYRDSLFSRDTDLSPK